MRRIHSCLFFGVLCLLPVSLHAGRPAVKNIILMIGDGMGPPQVDQAIQYRRWMKPEGNKLALERLFESASLGLVSTASYDNLVTDSAAAATAMACGIKTRNTMIGVDPDGQPCESILKIAKERNLSVGLVTTTAIADATPASFSANAVDRDDDQTIAPQMLEQNVDLLLGGGGREWIPKGIRFSDIPECKGIPSELDGPGKGESLHLIDEAKSGGYTFVCTVTQLKRAGGAERLLGLFGGSHLPHVPDREGLTTLPSLSEMTQAALGILSRNKEGFFLMVEGGRIDHAAHANDAGTQLQETLDFDRSIQVVLDFIEKEPKTLLVVTADHSTANFGLAFRQEEESKRPKVELPTGQVWADEFRAVSPRQIYPLLMGQKISYYSLLKPIVEKLNAKEGSFKKAVSELLDRIHEKTLYTLTEEEARFVLKKEPETISRGAHLRITAFHYPLETSQYTLRLAHVLSWQNSSVFATATHEATPVYAFSLGPEKLTRRLSGYIENTEIAAVMKNALGAN